MATVFILILELAFVFFHCLHLGRGKKVPNYVCVCGWLVDGWGGG